MRKIIHIDMDSFFASVEQRDFPEYRGKPLVVGRRGPRAVVAAASYEAREYGVRSAMPMVVALRKCPHLIVAPHRFSVYQAVSGQIRSIFYGYTDLVEPLSLDEAYLDVTNPHKGPDSATMIAKEIKKEIFDLTGLIASAGVSYNKFLAKIASDMDKPDGLYLIEPKDADSFLNHLEIGKFFGVGRRTEEKMHKLGVFTGKDLKTFSKLELEKHFGKSGRYYFHVVRGEDDRPVMAHRERKSIGTERTYDRDFYDVNEVKEKLQEIIDITWERVEKKGKKGKTITLKVRFSDFTTITRSASIKQAFTKQLIVQKVFMLFPEEDISQKGIRLLGVTLSGFQEEGLVKSQSSQLEMDFNA